MLASTSEPALPRITFGSHTEVGKRRENNEDSSRCAILAPGTPQQSTLLVVSDGVGGSSAGEVASRTAVDSLHELLSERLGREFPPADRRGWLDAVIRETDLRVRKAAIQAGYSDMAATLSALWIADDHAWWGQAGDSRIYRLQRGELRQLSRDQSPVGRLRADGSLTEEQARAHQYRHLIDQCLGGTGPNVEPETSALAVKNGDVFLLCSDGLSDGLWDKEIAAGLMLAGEGRTATEIACALVTQANEASGRDNITAVVACVGGDPARRLSRKNWIPWFKKSAPPV